MKYILILLVLASCSHKTTPVSQYVVFDHKILNSKKWEKKSRTRYDTAWLKMPLEVASGLIDTVRLMPGYGTKGYQYKVAIINDTLRIVDSIKKH